MNATKIVPDHALGQALQRILEQGKKPPCFRVNGLRITMASDASVNPGFLYVKNDNWDYIGKVTTDGTMELRFPSLITDAQKTTLLDAIHHPLDIAMASGKVTGKCCCCGRKLTNKLSIKLGIGPICRDDWFPDSIDPEPEQVTMDDLVGSGEPEDYITPQILEDKLDAIDSLDLELSMSDSVAIVSEPTVDKLVTIYKSLDNRQRNLFLDIIERAEDGI